MGMVDVVFSLQGVCKGCGVAAMPQGGVLEVRCGSRLPPRELIEAGAKTLHKAAKAVVAKAGEYTR